MSNFDSFALNPALSESIQSMGYKSATPIQLQAIPIALEGKDLIACAQTGTGKTAAFLIPILHQILERPSTQTKVRTVILCPTREIAKQIDEQAQGFGYFCSTSSIAVYGGGQGDVWEQQRRAITEGCDVLIATPGRLIAHMQMGYVDLTTVEFLVLDEADKMLDMGFYEDILKIIQDIPKKRQTMLFSATMPAKIRQLANSILNNPEQISISISKPAEGIDQQAYMVYDNKKIALLESLFKPEEVDSMILFTSRKDKVNDIVRSLKKLNFKVGGISSNNVQSEREDILLNFKSGVINILVATDVLSRGIDIEGISHVINFDVPPDAEDYIHRIGRTARANTKGTAITFIGENDQFYFKKIEDLLERSITKKNCPENLGASPEYNPGEKRKIPIRKGGTNFKRKKVN